MYPGLGNANQISKKNGTAILVIQMELLERCREIDKVYSSYKKGLLSEYLT
jgi:hypothetical protein